MRLPYLKHTNVVAIVPLDTTGNVALVKQWRYVQRARHLEIPSGCLERYGENPLRAAKRELKEETGLTAKRWTKLGSYYQANTTRVMYCYLAEYLTTGKTDFDATEDITVHWYPWGKAMAALRDGAIMHGTSAIALLRADQYLQTSRKHKL